MDSKSPISTPGQGLSHSYLPRDIQDDGHLISSSDAPQRRPGSDEDDNNDLPESERPDGGANTGKQAGVASNKQVTSRFRGVCWNKKNKRWQAVIHSNGKYVYLGSFTSEDEAGRAFDMAAIKIRGAKTKLNFQYADYVDEHGRLIEDDRFPMIAALQPGSDRVRGSGGGRGRSGPDGSGSRLLDGGGLGSMSSSPLLGYGGGLKMLGGSSMGGGYHPVLMGSEVQLLPSAAAAAVSAGVHVEGVVPSGVRDDLYGMVYRLPNNLDKTCCALLDRGITHELGTYLHLEDAKQACSAGLALYLRLHSQIDHLAAQLAAARSHTMLPQGLGLGAGDSVQHFQYIPMTVLQPEPQQQQQRGGGGGGQGLGQNSAETVQHFQYVPMSMLQPDNQRTQTSSPQLLPMVSGNDANMSSRLPSGIDTASLGELRNTATGQPSFNDSDGGGGGWRSSAGGLSSIPMLRDTPDGGNGEEGGSQGLSAMAGMAGVRLRDTQWMMQQREDVDGEGHEPQMPSGSKRRHDDDGGSGGTKRQQVGDAYGQDFNSMSKLLTLGVAEVQRVVLSNNS